MEKNCKHFTPGEFYFKGQCIFRDHEKLDCINPAANKEALQ